VSTPPHDDFELPEAVPLVPIRDRVVCPFAIVPLVVSRRSSARAIEAAVRANGEHLVHLCTQRDPGCEEPEPADLFDLGCVATIVQLDQLDDGRLKVLVQGLVRARMEAVVATGPCLMVRPERVEDLPPTDDDVQTEALLRTTKANVERFQPASRDMPEELPLILRPVESPGRLADLVASYLVLKVSAAQALLETLDPVARLQRVNEAMEKELGIREMQQQIEARAQAEMSRTHREFFLRQQLRAIRTELGDESDGELDELRARVEGAQMPPHALDEALRLLRRLRRSPPESGEAAMLRTALERLSDLPWSVRTDDTLDLVHARAVLDRDHHGLDCVKERILDFLAVRRLKPDQRGPILCFTGPPGVGKTSLGRSIARAMGRRCAQVSLGGVRDEAAIRGHRRTYVGAMPGRIIQGLQQAGSKNPVFILDEVDKLGAGTQGDPAAALLEVLDPAQNDTFRDTYLNVAFDLSNVLFVCTANLSHAIPAALRDRMEVIELTSYTEQEKLEIARRHILPRAMSDHGLPPGSLALSTRTLTRIIRDYTSEAGLRDLERRTATVCRKIARRVAEGKTTPTSVQPARLQSLLGPPRPPPHALPDTDQIGVVVALAWTGRGGEVLPVEATRMRGSGALKLTGQLGDVMKESAHTALSFLRSRADEYGIDPEFFAAHEVHVHVPAGAIPKDGPSAGVAIAAALASVALDAPVRAGVAMTGEMTLRGHVLAVGGLKEKSLAAVRAGVHTLLFPAANAREIEALPGGIRRRLRVIPCRTVDDLFREALIGVRRPLTLAGAG